MVLLLSRIALNGLLEMARSLASLSLLNKKGSQIGVGSGVIRLHTQRLTETGFGQRVFLLGDIGNSQVVIGPGILGKHLDQFLIFGGGRLGVTALLQVGCKTISCLELVASTRHGWHWQDASGDHSRAGKPFTQGAFRMLGVGRKVVDIQAPLVDDGDTAIPVDQETDRNRQGLRAGDQVIVDLLEVGDQLPGSLTGGEGQFETFGKFAGDRCVHGVIQLINRQGEDLNACVTKLVIPLGQFLQFAHTRRAPTGPEIQ